MHRTRRAYKVIKVTDRRVRIEVDSKPTWATVKKRHANHPVTPRLVLLTASHRVRSQADPILGDHYI